MITWPQGLTLKQWADAVIIDLNSKNILVGDWQKWAEQFNLELETYNLPNPYMFDDWNLWAERLCGEING